MKGHRFTDRLGFAWAGLRTAWRMEKSLRTHALATVGVVAALLITRAPPLWWAVMTLTIALVVGAELLNTAIEALEQMVAGDQLQIQRLKKRKLHLKDQINRIEDQLTPDIIA